MRAGGVVGTAVVAALAAAAISPDRFDQVWDRITGADASTAPTVTYARVASGDAAVSVEVPSSWFSIDKDPSILPNYKEEGIDPGSAVLAGTTTQPAPNWGQDNVFVAASSVTPARLGLAGAAPDRLRSWVDGLSATNDWTLEGCRLGRADDRNRTRWMVAVRRWDDCAGVPGTRLWEYYAVSDDGRTLALVFVVLAPSTPDEVAERAMATWEVAPERLPSVSPSGGGDLVLP